MRTRKRNNRFPLLLLLLLFVAFVVGEEAGDDAGFNEKEKRNPNDENTGTTSTLFGTDAGEQFSEEMVLVFPPFISVVVREVVGASSNGTVSFDEKKNINDYITNADNRCFRGRCRRIWKI